MLRAFAPLLRAMDCSEQRIEKPSHGAKLRGVPQVQEPRSAHLINESSTSQRPQRHCRMGAFQLRETSLRMLRLDADFIAPSGVHCEGCEDCEDLQHIKIEDAKHLPIPGPTAHE